MCILPSADPCWKVVGGLERECRLVAARVALHTTIPTASMTPLVELAAGWIEHADIVISVVSIVAVPTLLAGLLLVARGALSSPRERVLVITAFVGVTMAKVLLWPPTEPHPRRRVGVTLGGPGARGGACVPELPRRHPRRHAGVHSARLCPVVPRLGRHHRAHRGDPAPERRRAAECTGDIGRAATRMGDRPSTANRSTYRGRRHRLPVGRQLARDSHVLTHLHDRSPVRRVHARRR